MKIVKDDFPQQIEIKPGYEKFFGGVMDIVHSMPISNELGEELRAYTQRFLEQDYDSGDFQEYSDNRYTRVHLGKDDSGWEALMMCWKRGNSTTIHGHPQFAAYNFADGDFKIEVFCLGEDGTALPDAIFEATGGQGFYAVGEAGRFDNHIHRITCLSDTGHSLHIYSDDARKGIAFD
jgi:predicted metal-dependent enzyme (double-stranded beta helix superfamily)